MNNQLVISQVHRLQLENATLRFLNATDKVTIATLHLRLSTEVQNTAKEALDEARQDVESEYGIDLSSQAIDERGKVIARSMAGGVQELLQKIRTS